MDRMVMGAAWLLTIVLTAAVTAFMIVSSKDSHSSIIKSNNMIQHVQSFITPLHVLYALVQMVYSVVAPLTLLLWWMGVSTAQARAWLHQHALPLKDGLKNLRASTTSFMSVTTGEAMKAELAALKGEVEELKKEDAKHMERTSGLEESSDQCLAEMIHTWEAILSAWSGEASTKTTLELKNHSNISDTTLHHVAAMTHLTSIDLDNSSGFCGKGMKRLYKLPHLKRLSLRETVVSDNYLEGIGALSSLGTLILSGTQVTDVGLQLLTGLSFKILELNSCEAVTSAGMVHVGRLTGLEQLYLGDLGVKDDGLRHLSSLTSLKLLILPDGVTDSGVEHLKHLTALRKLDITGCEVTEGAVKWLKGLPAVTHISTDVESLQGWLKVALPGVTVGMNLKF